MVCGDWRNVLLQLLVICSGLTRRYSPRYHAAKNITVLLCSDVIHCAGATSYTFGNIVASRAATSVILFLFKTLF
jgi:hypothetical protein